MSRETTYAFLSVLILNTNTIERSNVALVYRRKKKIFLVSNHIQRSESFWDPEDKTPYHQTLCEIVDDGHFDTAILVHAGSLFVNQKSHDSHSVHVICNRFCWLDAAVDPSGSLGALKIK